MASSSVSYMGRILSRVVTCKIVLTASLMEHNATATTVAVTENVSSETTTSAEVTQESASPVEDAPIEDEDFLKELESMEG